MFWKKGQRQRKIEMENVVQTSAQSLSEQMRGVKQDLTEKSDMMLEQMNKLGRLQYKTSHDTADKLQKLSAGVEELLGRQATAEQAGSRITVLERHLDNMVQENIRLIDDLDSLCHSLANEVQERWVELLKQWTNRMLLQINDIGIREIPVLGMVFDPRWCESVGTVELDMTVEKQLYEVVKVIRRGFVQSNGNIMRKAQVITTRGGANHDER